MKLLLPAIISLGASFYGALNQNVWAQTTTDSMNNNLPDLVVTSVGVMESEDQIGADAHLIARIENRGAGATKRDVAHGVAFYVDGEFVAWSDTYRQILKPGQFAILRSNSGPNGGATWKITPGKHTIRAIVDDALRIEESNEDNNSLEKTFDWKTPVAMNLAERTEFTEVSREVYAQLSDLQKSGLFKVSNPWIRNEPTDKLNKIPLDITRYEAAVVLARLQDAMPDLKSDDKSQRLRTINAVATDAGYKLSAAEIENLDGEILDLRVELEDAIARLMQRNTSIEIREPRTVVAPPRLSLPPRQ